MTDSPVKADNGTALARLIVTSDGAAETRRVAAVLSALVGPGDLIVLTGDLGAGKTCFTQGLGAGLGIEERITSPTFTLANRYVGTAPAADAGGGPAVPLVLHHLDVYRLESVAETIDLDLPDLLESGVTVIEWGEQISEVLPAEHLTVALRYPELDDPVSPEKGVGSDRYVVDADAETKRIIELSAEGGSWLRRLAALEDLLGSDNHGNRWP